MIRSGPRGPSSEFLALRNHRENNTYTFDACFTFIARWKGFAQVWSSPLSHFLCFTFISRWKGFSQVWSFPSHTHFLCFMFISRWKGFSQVWSFFSSHTLSLLYVSRSMEGHQPSLKFPPQSQTHFLSLEEKVIWYDNFPQTHYVHVNFFYGFWPK